MNNEEEHYYRKALKDVLDKASELQWCGVGLEGVAIVTRIVKAVKEDALEP